MYLAYYNKLHLKLTDNTYNIKKVKIFNRIKVLDSLCCGNSYLWHVHPEQDNRYSHEKAPTLLQKERNNFKNYKIKKVDGKSTK